MLTSKDIKKSPMVKVASDGITDYYEISMPLKVVCLRYFFELVDCEGNRIYYGNYSFWKKKPQEIAQMFDCPVKSKEEDRFLVPKWAKGKVVYQIFPDRFASSNEIDESLWYSAPVKHFMAKYGGNLRGIIDKLGYKVVMIADTLILVIVCFFYGFAHHLFPQNVAFIVCCINYVLDAVISLASMASNLYVQDLSENGDEVKATISTGVSINHVITIFIALFGGWIWQTLGMELLFIASAVLGLCNSAYAATIKSKK